MRPFIKLFFCLSLASALSACEIAPEFGAGYNFLDAGVGAAEAYPNLPAFEAQKRHAQDQFKVIADKQRTDADKREVAAAFYAGFANYNARAIPAYCKRVNRYPADFVDRFYKMNKKEEKALEEVLALRKMTKDVLWEKHERKMMSRAKYDLMGGNLGPGSSSACSKIQKTPGFFLQRTNFSQQFPSISRALTH